MNKKCSAHQSSLEEYHTHMDAWASGHLRFLSEPKMIITLFVVYGFLSLFQLHFDCQMKKETHLISDKYKMCTVKEGKDQGKGKEGRKAKGRKEGPSPREGRWKEDWKVTSPWLT